MERLCRAGKTKLMALGANEFISGCCLRETERASLICSLRFRPMLLSATTPVPLFASRGNASERFSRKARWSTSIPLHFPSGRPR